MNTSLYNNITSSAMPKLNNVLLIDDSKSTNFFNKLIIEKMPFAPKVIITENGMQALEYLQSNTEDPTVPELIFLDINMPVMNGWQFLDAYSDLEEKYKGSSIILMLGAALKPEDETKVNKMDVVKGFSAKMLNSDELNDIITKFV